LQRGRWDIRARLDVSSKYRAIGQRWMEQQPMSGQQNFCSLVFSRRASGVSCSITREVGLASFSDPRSARSEIVVSLAWFGVGYQYG
jgi:hypothetical protein